MKLVFEELHGMFSLIFICLNTIFWCLPLIVLAILKFIIPLEFWRHFCTVIINWISISWTSVNNFSISLTKNVKWQITGLDELKKDGWYLVLSNHQTWIDIIILQKIFNRKIPFFRFFLKKELIWIPMLGLAWWALDYPFMKRYSKKQLKEKPHLKGKDLEITKKACSKYKKLPVSIMNFVEGTRFTKEKHERQNSPYKNLLRPKAGGVGYVLSAMGDQLTNILNVTIAYPDGNRFWDFLCGRIKNFKVHIETIEVSDELKGDYLNDEKYREFFQNWVNEIWEEKDKKIDEMLV